MSTLMCRIGAIVAITLVASNDVLAQTEAYVISDDVLEEGTARLHRIDLATGATEFIGDLQDEQGTAWAGSFAGLAFDASGRLLASRFLSLNLEPPEVISCCYLAEIDPATAIVTPIGMHNIAPAQSVQSIEQIDPESSYRGGGFLAGYEFNSALGEVDLDNGSFTSFGGTAIFNIVGALAYESRSDVLYGLTQFGELVSFDPESGNVQPEDGVPIFNDDNFFRSVFPSDDVDTPDEFVGVLGAAYNDEDGLIYAVAHIEGDWDPDDSPGEGLFTNRLNSLLFTLDVSNFDGVNTETIVTNLIGDTGTNWLSGLAIRQAVNCDWDGDGACNLRDLSSENGLYSVGDLVAGVAVSPNNSNFDLTKDGRLDGDDLAAWLAAAATKNGVAGPYLPGDANLDGEVTFADFLSLSTNFGTGREWSQGNFDGNSAVDFGDFLLISSNFGGISGQVTAVPEATARSLVLVLGLFGFAPMRRWCGRRRSR